MLGILPLYLGSSFVVPFFMSAAFFSLFLLTFQLFKITQLVINKGVEISVILEMVLHILITLIPLAIPISTLFATIYTMNKISTDSEFVAIRSFGISKEKPFEWIMQIVSLLLDPILHKYFLNKN